MKVSEAFYSVQGEGASVGTPAYFVRLSGCNLVCGGPGGALVASGRATWWCDSERLWREGTELTNEELLERIRSDGDKEGVDLLDGILEGIIHVVWTGGEPALPRNRKAIASFLDYLDHYYPGNGSYHELETNGTIACGDGFYDRFDQINCSPKLSNCGMPAKRRIVPEAIAEIQSHRNPWFKFVVSAEGDLSEIDETFIRPFSIDKRRVILMPAVDTRADLPAVTRFLYDLCKKHGYRGVTRSHILAWDRTTGV